jgi:nicotinamide-nucleotide amidase
LKKAVNRIIELLNAKQQCISFAESITGGMLSSCFVDVPGASKVYLGSAVCYSDYAKESVLNIPHSIIEKHSAVSYKCAYYMAKSTLKLYNSDYAVATTGYAGPTGNPVGECFVAIATKKRVCVHRLKLKAGRNNIRRACTAIALIYLYKFLKGSKQYV